MDRSILMNYASYSFHSMVMALLGGHLIAHLNPTGLFHMLSTLRHGFAGLNVSSPFYPRSLCALCAGRIECWTHSLVRIPLSASLNIKCGKL